MPFENVELDFNPVITTPLRDALAALWLDVSRSGGAIGFTETSTLDEISHDVDMYLAKVTSGKLHLLIATDQGAVVGCCVFVPNDLVIQEHFITLKRFTVHPSRQRTGLGRWMVERACLIAQEQLHIESVHVTVRSGHGNEVFWERCGFKQVAVLPDVVKLPDGTYRDSLYLVRQVGSE